MGVTFTIANKYQAGEKTKVNTNSNVKITNYAEGKKGNNAIEIFVQDGKSTITGTDGNGKATGTKGGLRTADFNTQKYDFMEKLINEYEKDGNNTLSEADLEAAMKKGVNGAKVIADENCNQNGKYTVKFQNGEMLTFDFETDIENYERLHKEAAELLNKTNKQELQQEEMKLSPQSTLEKIASNAWNFIKNTLPL